MQFSDGYTVKIDAKNEVFISFIGDQESRRNLGPSFTFSVELLTAFDTFKDENVGEIKVAKQAEYKIIGSEEETTIDEQLDD